MKLVKVGAIAILVAAASVAHADEPSDAAEGEAIQKQISAALTAIQKKQAGKATALMAEAVTIEGLPFQAAACSKSFGAAKRSEVTGAMRAKLVTCLAKEKWFSARLPFRVEKRDGTWTVWIKLRRGDLLTEVQLQKKDDGSSVIKGIHAPLVDGIEGGAAGTTPEPIAGGVVYVDPRPPQSAETPMNVPPTLLESYRTGGEKAIVPDDPTKLEIQKANRDKIIASFKLCLDPAGKVSVVKLLKASGFPAYDKKIEAGMRAWTYKPYLVEGKPAPVCSAVTFIYSQK